MRTALLFLGPPHHNGVRPILNSGRGRWRAHTHDHTQSFGVLRESAARILASRAFGPPDPETFDDEDFLPPRGPVEPPIVAFNEDTAIGFVLACAIASAWFAVNALRMRRARGY